MSKQNETPWEKRSMMSRIASVMYPDHCSEETRKQMQDIANAAGKRSPMQRFDKKGTKR